MDLRKLIDTVIDSAPDDWYLIADAPSFRDHLEFYEVYDGQANVLHAESHGSVGVYIPDVSITIAWGLEWNKDFQEEWCKKFPDPKAHGGFLDMFFNNALVYRTAYVWVDGIHLPRPRHTGDGKLEVRKRACDLMNLVDGMGKSPRQGFNPYEADVKRAGFTVIDEEWPRLPR
jgi:hypothetical protein